MKDLITREYRTVSGIAGPLLFVERVKHASIGEMVELILSSGEIRRGQVIELSERQAVIQVLEETLGLGVSGIAIRLTDSAATMDLSPDLLGRQFNGGNLPIDHLPRIIPDSRMEIVGQPINPLARDKPAHCIQTGISAIDGLNTLVRGQKLPIFSGAGLPAKELVAQIVCQATIRENSQTAKEPFAIIFAAMGLTFREASFFMQEFEQSGALEHAVLFMNLADDPIIERLLTPRYALTAAEYLAFTQGLHVLVILTDMTAYCDALRQISTARKEISGRRGYPGYMYSDLASLYERAGRIKGKSGSITQLPIVTLPDDDITHPIPDLTGYITEGQIVLSRELHLKGIFPPIDVLPSLSRLMDLGIGPGKSREDHRSVADQLYALYAQGRDVRRMTAIVGEEGLTESDKRLLQFAKNFEQEFVNQGQRSRNMDETLDLGWKFLNSFPQEQLVRIPPDLIKRYYKG